jgi:hypothetical protein|nr:MAG TPA: hypothetical protein [Caudoviricetes sp.]
MNRKTIFMVMATAVLAGGCGYILGRWSRDKECKEEVKNVRKKYSDLYSDALDKFSKKEQEFADVINERAYYKSTIDINKPDIMEYVKKYRGEGSKESVVEDILNSNEPREDESVVNEVLEDISDEEAIEELEEQEEADNYIPKEAAPLYPDDGDIPYIITEEESGTTGYTEVYATLYADDYLVEDHTAEEIDIDVTIGIDTLDIIRSSDADYIFVRNPKLGIDYGVTTTSENWTDVAKEHYDE